MNNEILKKNHMRTLIRTLYNKENQYLNTPIVISEKQPPKLQPSKPVETNSNATKQKPENNFFKARNETTNV